MTNIERIRKIRGLTQGDLAEMVGVKQPHISRIEKGDDGPPLRLFAAIADALHVSLSDLFADDRSDLETILVAAFRRLSPDRQQGWVDLAQDAAGPVQSDQ